jgi:phosphoenolpyruvate carboxykinase (ATP)
VFGLRIPKTIPGGVVPAEVLRPRNTWADPRAYDAKAQELARRFRDNDAKYEMAPDIRAAGPRAV